MVHQAGVGRIVERGVCCTSYCPLYRADSRVLCPVMALASQRRTDNFGVPLGIVRSMDGAHSLFEPVFLPTSSTRLYRLCRVWHTHRVYLCTPTATHRRQARRVELAHYVMEREHAPSSPCENRCNTWPGFAGAAPDPPLVRSGRRRLPHQYESCRSRHPCQHC